MYISRRQFLKYCTIAAGALGLTATDLFKLEKALASAGGLPVNWIAGQACTGCTTSLANAVQTVTIEQLLLGVPGWPGAFAAGTTGSVVGADGLTLELMETLSAATGDNLPAQVYTGGPFVLAVEGAIPATAANTPNDGYCTIGSYSGAASENVGDVVSMLAHHANCYAILAIGQCASFGGVPGASGNVTGARGVIDYLANPAMKAKTINLPGCPPSPEWVVTAVVAVLTSKFGSFPTLDNTNRPMAIYGKRTCNTCYRYPQAGQGHFVNPLLGNQLGDPTINHCNGTEIPVFDTANNMWSNPDTAAYCLRRAGCRGQRVQSNCGTMKWNSDSTGFGTGVNWCVGAGAGCQGCSQKGFPDAFSPFWTLK